MSVTEDLQLLKPAEVAKLLGISRGLTYALMQEHIIPVVHIGKTAVRVRRLDLEAFIRASRRVADDRDIMPQAEEAEPRAAL